MGAKWDEQTQKMKEAQDSQEQDENSGQLLTILLSGSGIRSGWRSNDEVRSRIDLAVVKFVMMGNIWKVSCLYLRLRMRLYSASAWLINYHLRI